MRPTFANLLAAAADRAGLTQKATRQAVEAFIAQLPDAVWQSGRVNVPGLGSFRVRSRKPRRIASPQGTFIKHMTLPAMRVVACRVSSSWRRR